MAIVIDPKTTSIAVPVISRLIDRFRRQERIKIEWTSPDYERYSLLWGLFEWESGERKTIIIEGPPGFCSAALKELYGVGGKVSLIDRVKM